MELQDGAKIALEISRVSSRYILEQVARVGRQGIKPMAANLVFETEEALWIALEKMCQVRLAEIGMRRTNAIAGSKQARG
jgi:hypothetical protein